MERERQLELQLSHQEAELRRLQEELQRLSQQQQAAHHQNHNVAVHAPIAAISGLAASGGVALPQQRKRYMFSQFSATLLAPPTNGPQLYPCEGHSAVAHEGRVIMFGGTNGSTITNDTIAFNIATGRWRRLAPSSPKSGAVPSPRYGHSAVLHQGKMIVYGGFGPGGVTSAAAGTEAASAGSRAPTGLLSSMHALDLHSGDWTTLGVGAGHHADVQMPSKNHAAVAYQGRMYVFGGCLPEGRTNAVRCYDIEKQFWLPADQLNQQAIACNAAKSAATPGTLMAQSDVPAPRSGHSAVLAVRNGHASLVSFGGRLSKFAFCSDVFSYDLALNRWVRLYCGGDIPEGRCDHSAVLFRDHMVVYGGYAIAEGGAKKYFNDVYTLDLITCTWSRVEVLGSMLPLGSCGHAAVLFETTDNVVCMAAIGGWGRVPEPFSLADEEAERTLKQHEGDVSYRTINDVWLFQIAKATDPSAASGTGASRPTSARNRAISPRQPAAGQSPSRLNPSRPSTARSGGRPASARSRAGSSSGRHDNKPAFVTQSSKATTCKLFGEPPATERTLRIAQGSPKRSHDELQAICDRLTSNKLHEAKLEALKKKHLKEKDVHPLSAEEQQDITDRLFYQQILVAEDRRKALEAKYLATQEREHVPDDQIQEVVSRLCQPLERPELEPIRTAKQISKSQAAALLTKLYKEDAQHRADEVAALEKKYVWGPAAPKKPLTEIQEAVQRLAVPTTTTPRVSRR